MIIIPERITDKGIQGRLYYLKNSVTFSNFS